MIPLPLSKDLAVSGTIADPFDLDAHADRFRDRRELFHPHACHAHSLVLKTGARDSLGQVRPLVIDSAAGQVACGPACS